MLGIRDTRYQELGQPQRWLQQLQREQDRGRGRQKGLTGEEQASLPPSFLLDAMPNALYFEEN